jgi:hypothetical protein
MEGLAQLVNESLARNGFQTTPDHNRVRWSRWFPCGDSLSALFVPSKPGLLALGEEIIAPGEAGSKRMLALFQVSETDDLGLALGRLLLAGPERARLASAACFARYAVIEDAAQRRSALHAFERWMADSAQTTSGLAMQELGIG